MLAREIVFTQIGGFLLGMVNRRTYYWLTFQKKYLHVHTDSVSEEWNTLMRKTCYNLNYTRNPV